MNMKRQLFFVFCVILLCVSCSTTSQFKSITAGNVGDYLKQTPQAAEFPDAGAILLHSYAYVEFFKDGTSVMRHVERYKIFNERGRKHATKTISYREGYQRASILFANTIKANGQVVPLAQQDIFDGTQYAGYDFYTDIKHKRFTMPAVEDGCIVEYASEIKNLKPSFGFDYSTIFLCRNLYPMEEDILEVVLPSDKELNFKPYNTDLAPKIISEGDKKRYVFTNLKQKSIIPEPRMPSLLDRETFPQVWIWTMKDWKSISSWYIRLVNEQMKSNLELESFTRQLIEGKKTKEEKISAIFNFVSQNIRYIAVLLGPHTHKPHAAFEVFQKRYGDCKDKTVLLLTMLRIAGIEGQPALVPSHREYFDETMPSIGAFNHVIAAVPNGKEYFWLDATNEVSAFDSAPFTRPTKVFLINGDGSYRFLQPPEPDEKKDHSKSTISLKLDEEGNADAYIHYTYFGKAAEAIRYIYKYLPPEQRKKSFEQRGIEVLDLEIGSFSETESPFFIRLKGKLKNLAQVIDPDTMILSNVIRLDAYRDITAASQRLYPIVLHPSFHTQETFRYILPDGFSVRRIPQSFSSHQPHNIRKETFTMQGSVFEVYVENSNRERKIIRTDIDGFKRYALELQKHETAMKNIILERK
jgi:hypothetical protein